MTACRRRRSTSTVMSMSWVARGAPRTATACPPKTNQGSPRPSSTRARTSSVSPTADMGRTVEHRADVQVGGEIGTANRLARPIGPGRTRRLVELDGEPHLLLDRQVRSMPAGPPLRCAPVAAGVASELRHVEGRAHGDRDDSFSDPSPTPRPADRLARFRSFTGRAIPAPRVRLRSTIGISRRRGGGKRFTRAARRGSGCAAPPDPAVPRARSVHSPRSRRR